MEDFDNLGRLTIPVEKIQITSDYGNYRQRLPTSAGQQSISPKDLHPNDFKEPDDFQEPISSALDRLTSADGHPPVIDVDYPLDVDTSNRLTVRLLNQLIAINYRRFISIIKPITCQLSTNCSVDSHRIVTISQLANDIAVHRAFERVWN